MRTLKYSLIFGVSLLAAAVFSTPALAQKSPDNTMARSLGVLSEITRNPKTGMPRLVLRNAHALAIIPDMFKMSFVFGARFGRGILVVKQPDGTWSNPMFIHLAGGSFGAQAGAQSTDLILVFQSPKGLDRFLKNKGKLTLGVDVGAAAGPAGKRFEAATDVGLKSEILSYSNTRGIFAGVSAEGGTLQIDWRANNLYYGQPTSPAAILALNSPLAVPESTLSLQQLLIEKTATPERIVRTRRPANQPVIINEPFFEDPDGVEIEGAVRDEPVVGSASPRARSAPRRPVQPRIDDEPDELDELDELPPPARRRPSATPSPRTTNDEDLPEAIPSTVKPKTERKPSAKPAPVEPDDLDDDEPLLDAPRTGAEGGKPRSGV